MNSEKSKPQPVIESRQLWKTYSLSAEKSSTLKEKILRGGRGKRTETRIDALKNVNFAIHRGEIVGLIGNNGSGKSTLLKLIAGITQPSQGELSVNGTVSSLLEVGVGFHPEMTGRENVYLSGALLGISENELSARMPDIVAFSELEEFIDSPVKHFSSGMYLRLGFAIGVHVQPDVLLIDEILAVGDQRFQRKCKEHIRQLRRTGKTIILVSHDLDAIQALCDRALVLHKGEIIGDGYPYEMISFYKQQQFQEARLRGEELSAEIVKRNRFGKFDIKFLRARLRGAAGDERYVFETGEPLRIEFAWSAKKPIPYPVFGVSIIADDGTPLYTIATDITVGDVDFIEGEGLTTFDIEALNLLEGAYSLTFGIASRLDGPGSEYNFYDGYDLCLEMCPFLVRRGRKGYGMSGFSYMPCQGAITPYNPIQ
ncbi:MAG: ABC transporter ATP-binding protein [Candidatus Omnitrophota bacterium]